MREGDRNKWRKNEITQRSEWSSAHFRLIAGDVYREKQGDFVHMRAQIQIGELGVENDSAKELNGERARSKDIRDNNALEYRPDRWNISVSTGRNIKSVW